MNGKLFYTTLDMENRNSIAVDKKVKTDRLQHNHEERIKLISNK